MPAPYRQFERCHRAQCVEQLRVTLRQVGGCRLALRRFDQKGPRHGGLLGLSYKHHQSFMAMTPGLHSLTLHNKVDWPQPWPATGDAS